jgi:hypothetical protein
MDNKKVMQQAMEALENAVRYHGIMLMSDPPQDAWKFHRVEDNAKQAITALREALAQPVQEQPVSCRFCHSEKGCWAWQCYKCGEIDDVQQPPPLPVQEPVAYDKTEMNSFVIDLYDEKMKEGKHGHYETLFHCVHQAIKRAAHNIKENT